jgi:hypothetical protein
VLRRVRRPPRATPTGPHGRYGGSIRGAVAGAGPASGRGRAAIHPAGRPRDGMANRSDADGAAVRLVGARMAGIDGRQDRDLGARPAEPPHRARVAVRARRMSAPRRGVRPAGDPQAARRRGTDRRVERDRHDERTDPSGRVAHAADQGPEGSRRPQNASLHHRPGQRRAPRRRPRGGRVRVPRRMRDDRRDEHPDLPLPAHPVPGRRQARHDLRPGPDRRGRPWFRVRRAEDAIRGRHARVPVHRAAPGRRRGVARPHRDRRPVPAADADAGPAPRVALSRSNDARDVPAG